jgi:hypothetical protein
MSNRNDEFLKENDSVAQSRAAVISINPKLHLSGAFFFLVGSILYYPLWQQWINTFTLAAYLYTFGAILYLVGGTFDALYSSSKVQLAESTMLLLGDVLYLVGCVFYIPTLRMEYYGGVLFCYGSLAFIISGLIHLGHGIYSSQSASEALKLSSSKIAMFNIAGSFFYLYGAVLFFNLENDAALSYATTIFVIGSSMFGMAALFSFQATDVY